MDEQADAFRDWAVVGVNGRYYIGRLKPGYGERDTGLVLEETFEMLLIRQQQPSKEGVVLGQHQAWMSYPNCTGGVTMTVRWSELTRLSDMNDHDYAQYANFIKAAQESFLANRAAASGLVSGNQQDLRNLDRISRNRA